MSKLITEDTNAAWLRDNLTSCEDGQDSQFEELYLLKQGVHAALSKTGLPHKTWENWKYFKLYDLHRFNQRIDGSEVQGVGVNLPKMADAFNLVMTNGILDLDRTDADMPKGITLLPLSNAKDLHALSLNILEHDKQPFVQLSALYGEFGFAMCFDDGYDASTPVNIIYLDLLEQESQICHSYNIIQVAPNVKVDITQNFISGANGLGCHNVFAHCLVGADAHLNLTKLQSMGACAQHISSTHVHQAAGSSVNVSYYHFGALQSHETFMSWLEGEKANCEVVCLSLMKGKQQLDMNVKIHHQVSDCTSNQIIRSLADGSSLTSINGSIFVAEHASKTVADLQNKNLLLSKQSAVNTQPDLEIYNDDVICTHGATVGALNKDELFYLRARGLTHMQARQLLLLAFVSLPVDRVKNVLFREAIQIQVDGFLSTEKEYA
jgi:Fe-S cluster assembly protein SufD